MGMGPSFFGKQLSNRMAAALALVDWPVFMLARDAAITLSVAAATPRRAWVATHAVHDLVFVKMTMIVTIYLFH